MYVCTYGLTRKTSILISTHSTSSLQLELRASGHEAAYPPGWHSTNASRVCSTQSPLAGQEIPGVLPAGPRFPVPGPRFPVPAESGNGGPGFPDSRSFRPSRESGIPSPFPGRRPNRDSESSGERESGTSESVTGRHPPSAGPSLFKKKGGGRPESAFQGLKAASSPGSCLLYSHPQGVPRFPDLRPIGKRGISRFPIPAESGIGDSLPRSKFPGQIGNRGNGNGGFPGLVCPESHGLGLRPSNEAGLTRPAACHHWQSGAGPQHRRRRGGRRVRRSTFIRRTCHLRVSALEC
jgi:hypothetical protein